MKTLLFLLLAGFIYLTPAQSKQEILNNLQRGGTLDIQDASPTESYDVLMWDGDEVKLVTITVLGTTFSDITITDDLVISDDADIGGNITLENDEVLLNSTDAKLEFRYNDDAALLGQFIINSVNDTANLADNDNLEFVFRFYDDSLGATDWATIIVKATDVSDESEDSQIEFKTFAAGSEVTPLTLTGADATFAGTMTIVGGVIVNDAGANLDFRVETAGEDSAFVIDGADGDIYMEGLGTGSGTQLSRIAATDEIVEESSSMRFKNDIEDWNLDPSLIMEFQPRQFNWNEKSAINGLHDYGLVAEEVAGVLPELGQINGDGEIQAWSQPKMISYLVSVIQDQQKRIEKLESK